MNGEKVTTLVALAIITTAFVLLRLISRRLIKQRLWWDDWIMVVSLATNLGTLGVNIAQVSNQRSAASTSELDTIRRLFLASDSLYVTSLSLTKLSVLLMQYRIFDVAHNFKRWVWAVGAFVVVWWLIVFLLLLIEWWMVPKRWAAAMAGHAPGCTPAPLANSASSIAGDLILLIRPIPMVWKLRLRVMEKILLTLIFGLGFFVIAASIIRLVMYIRTVSTPTKLAQGVDEVIGWSDVEMSTGIICGCLPALRPIVQPIAKVLPRPSNRKERSSHGTMSKSNAASANRRLSGPATMPVAPAPTANRQSSHERLYVEEHDLQSILSIEVDEAEVPQTKHSVVGHSAV